MKFLLLVTIFAMIASILAKPYGGAVLSYAAPAAVVSPGVTSYSAHSNSVVHGAPLATYSAAVPTYAAVPSTYAAVPSSYSAVPSSYSAVPYAAAVPVVSPYSAYVSAW